MAGIANIASRASSRTTATSAAIRKPFVFTAIDLGISSSLLVSHTPPRIRPNKKAALPSGAPFTGFPWFPYIPCGSSS
jgi:hypothetical protein